MTLFSHQLETPEVLNQVKNKISLNFAHTREVLDQKNIFVNNQFAYRAVNRITSSKKTMVSIYSLLLNASTSRIGQSGMRQ